MDIETFKEIVAFGEGNGEPLEPSFLRPCPEGWAWLLGIAKDCKNTDQFFDKCKKLVKADETYENHDGSHSIRNILSPHAYLMYMFKFSLDWEGIGKPFGYSLDCGDEGYERFISEHWGVTETIFIPIPKLCDALKRAFK